MCILHIDWNLWKIDFGVERNRAKERFTFNSNGLMAVFFGDKITVSVDKAKRYALCG